MMRDEPVIVSEREKEKSIAETQRHGEKKNNNGTIPSPIIPM
jgi:hypothetical protein